MGHTFEITQDAQGIPLHHRRFDGVEDVAARVLGPPEGMPRGEYLEVTRSYVERGGDWVAWLGGLLSIEDAVAMFRGGWAEGAARAKTVAAPVVDSVAAKIERVDFAYDVEGPAVDVPEYLTGVPECFVRPVFTQVEAKSSRLIDVFVNLAASAAVPAEQIVNRGAGTLALVELLGYAGMRVRLTCMEQVRPTHHAYGWSIRWRWDVLMKDYDGILDAEKLAFAMCHPAMSRWIGIAMADHEPREVRELVGRPQAYGIPCNPNPTPGDVYVPTLVGSRDEWMTEDSVRTWVVEELKRQGVSFREEAA